MITFEFSAISSLVRDYQKKLIGAAAPHTKESLTVRMSLAPPILLGLPPSTSTNIQQNVGWQFMGHMVRATFVLHHYHFGFAL